MLDHRRVISNLPLFAVDGTGSSIDLDGIIGDSDSSSSSSSRIALVVFLRSLG